MTNSILTALNEIRLVVPLSSVTMVTRELQGLLTRVTRALLDYHTTAKSRMTPSETDSWGSLCAAVKNGLIPDNSGEFIIHYRFIPYSKNCDAYL